MTPNRPSTSAPKKTLHHMLPRVLEAISKLSERKGSSAKDILNYVRQSSETVYRNLTLQIRKALKQAVIDNQIRLRGGRYKIRPRTTTTIETKPPAAAAPSAPTTRPQPAPSLRTSSSDEKSKNSSKPSVSKKSRKEVKERKSEGKSKGRKSDKKASGKNAVAAKSHNTRSNSGPVTRSKSTRSKSHSTGRSKKSSSKK